MAKPESGARLQGYRPCHRGSTEQDRTGSFPLCSWHWVTHRTGQISWSFGGMDTRSHGPGFPHKNTIKETGKFSPFGERNMLRSVYRQTLGNWCSPHFIAEKTETLNSWSWMKVNHFLSRGQIQKQNSGVLAPSPGWATHFCLSCC